MIKLHKSEGFSLVELMIVVAIMAILAAIAIPSYLNFQMKARESEARTNLAAIKTCEESYKAETDQYRTCAAYPAAVPSATSTAWVAADAGNFTVIGFNPSGSVRYQYSVPTATAGTFFEGRAVGDLDGDTQNAIFTITNAAPVTKTNTNY